MNAQYDNSESGKTVEPTIQSHRSGVSSPRRAKTGPKVGPTLARLKEWLEEDRVARLALMFLDRYLDSHLKDEPVEWMDDHRRMGMRGQTVYNFGSDSFLGLDRDERVQKAMLEGMEQWGTHNGASRAFNSVMLCEDAERRLAEWLGVADTLIFPSVTLANVGLLPAVVGKGDLLILDRQSHDSLHQAAKIAVANGTKLVEISKCTPEALDQALAAEQYDHCVVAVDGVYSMTGDLPPLKELYQVTRRRDAVLYVDDAHATAMMGSRGRGAAHQLIGSLDDVLMVGSLSKAFSCMGAFVTCDARLKRLLKIRSSTFIFGGPVPPPYLAGVIAVCDILESSEYERMIQHLRAMMKRLITGVHALGLKTSGGDAGIVAVTVGDIEQTLKAGKFLFDQGYYVQSATYPAVPVLSGILRIQVNANHTFEAIDGLLAALARLKDEFGLTGA